MMLGNIKVDYESSGTSCVIVKICLSLSGLGYESLGPGK